MKLSSLTCVSKMDSMVAFGHADGSVSVSKIDEGQLSFFFFDILSFTSQKKKAYVFIK